MHKYLPVLLLAIILLIALGWHWQYKATPAGPGGPDTAVPEMLDHSERFDRTARLEYTVHARCRMDCRQVTETEIREILSKGRIDFAKSNLHDKPCPTYALEGYSHEGQHLRVIFAPCREATRVITCIDLDKKWKCNCD